LLRQRTVQTLPVEAGDAFCQLSEARCEKGYWTRPTSDALEVLGQQDRHGKRLSLGLGEAVDARHVVLNLKGYLATQALSVARHVEVAEVRTCAIGVDLVDRHVDRAAPGDLGDGSSGQGVLGLLSNIDVACQLGPTALVDNVSLDLGLPDQCGVLLARTDGGAIAS
jgi:hypothetical protein